MSVTQISDVNINRREHLARRIRELMENWTGNTMALAAELAEAAKTFPATPQGRPKKSEPLNRLSEPRFLKWATQVTGLSDRQIDQLVLIHERFGGVDRSTLKHLPQRVMKMLVRADVPESARREALDRAEKGEHIETDDAKKIIQGHKLPTAKEANAQAKAEGRPVFARDGKIYFGTDPAKAKEGEERRTMVYGVRRALDTLGNIHLTGRQFIDYAMPHQLWTPDEAKIIKQALRWLNSLDQAWDARG